MADSNNSVQATLEVVSHILTDADAANEVVVHNGWVEGLSQEQVALLFLASRYQSTVDVLSRQTATLKEEVNALTSRVDALGRQVFGPSAEDE